MDPPDYEELCVRVVSDVGEKVRALPRGRGLRRTPVLFPPAPFCPGGVLAGVPA